MLEYCLQLARRFTLEFLPSAYTSFSDLKAEEITKTCTLPDASGSAPQEIDPTKENEVLFTYSVQWKVSNYCIDSACLSLT